MCRSYLIIVLLLIISNCAVFAQSPDHYDTLTYDDYMNSKWKELVVHAKEAENQNALSTYCQKRLGYAYFMLKDYNASIYYYSQILDSNSTDADAQTMLYLNYLNNGKTAQMNRIRGFMNSDLESYLKLPTWKFLESIYAEGGFTFSNNFKENDNLDLYVNPHLFGAQKLTGDMSSEQIGLKFYPSHSVSIYLAYKNFNISSKQRYGATILTLTGTTLYHPPNGGPPYMRNNYASRDTIFSGKFKIIQSEYYANACIAFKNGNLTPFFHLINQNSGYIATPFHDSLYKRQPINFKDTIQRIYSFSVQNSTATSFVAGFSLAKQFGNFLLEGNLSLSNFESMSQKQIGASVTYYPLGNTHFSITPQFKYLSDSLNNNFITQLNVTIMLHKFCWLTAYASYGDLDHSNEQLGLVVFNNGDIFKHRYGATLCFPFSHRITVYLDAQIIQSQSWIFKLPDLMHPGYFWSNYQNECITIGLKYNL